MDPPELKDEISLPAKRTNAAMNAPDNTAYKRPNANRAVGNARTADGTGSVPEFIQKLFRMLENKAFRNTFCWGPDGTTFIVKDTIEFSKSILPKHFKHCNFASFVRQLNKYDFHKVRKPDDGHKAHGEQAWEFVHPKFRRDRKDLLEEIRRKTPGKQKKDETLTSAASTSASSSATAKVTQSTSSHASVIRNNAMQNGDLTEQAQVKLETVPSDSLDSVRQKMEALQAQIDQLQVLQNKMDAKIQQLNHSDRLILNEFINLNRNMATKDNLIRQFLQIAVKQEQAQSEISNAQTATGVASMPTLPTSSNGSDIQKLLDSYTKIAQSNAKQMENITKHLEQFNNVQTPWSETSVPSSIQQPVQQETFLPQQPTVPSQPMNQQQPQASSLPPSVPPSIQPDFGYQDPTTTAAAAAASMNAGSLIGSHVPLKNGDSVAFVTVGRLSPNMSFNDNKPAFEIKMQPEASSSRQVAAAGSSSGQVPSQAMPNSMSVKKKTGINWSVPPRVLLVDDDSVYRDLSGKLLQVIGCTIDLAKDGVEAIRKMGAEKYDLILMDIVMPNLDGISATRNIRQYDLMTPIISMTSNFTDNDIMQYVGSGMTDILPKPFSKNTLYNLLEKYCAHLKVIQRFQDPNAVHRGLGTLNMLPPPQVTELPPDGENSNNASASSSSSVSTMNAAPYIEEIGPSSAAPPIMPRPQNIPSSIPPQPTYSQQTISHSVTGSNLTPPQVSYPIAVDTIAAAPTSSLAPQYPSAPAQWSQPAMAVTTPLPAQTVIPSNDSKYIWPVQMPTTPVPHEFAPAMAPAQDAHERKRRKLND